jgi:hypothetical protein
MRDSKNKSVKAGASFVVGGPDWDQTVAKNESQEDRIERMKRELGGVNPTVSTFTFTPLESPSPSGDPNCETCQGKGEVLFLIARPGGIPGNQILPCPTCRAVP